MAQISLNEIREFIEPNIQVFHNKRLERLQQLRLKSILKRKNPYLFRAKNILTAQDFVKSILDAYLSSQEEGIFGGFLEELAIFICKRTYNGRKSSAEGIDLEFSKDDIVYIVSIKSGPNWGNSQQISRMKENFKKARRILRSNAKARVVIAINGCCYGRDDNPDKGDYLKLCGQRFWEFISGLDNLYTDIIEPIGYKAKEKNDAFYKQYSNVINRFTLEFAREFCDFEGSIMWEKLLAFNSSKEKNLELIF